MSSIKRLVLDLLKPHEVQNVEFAQEIAGVNGVEGVNASLLETDNEVQNLKLTIEGDDVDFRTIEETVETIGGTVHSVDEVACGDRLVEESPTHQD
jgi:hypothetical protein